LSSVFDPLQKFVPANAWPLLLPLLKEYPLHLKISKPRKTKFGDYRFPLKNEAHKISVNGNLNPYAFLITLLHEYAHLKAYVQYGRKILPHGHQWQQTFFNLCQPFFEAEIFPSSLAIALKNSLVKGHASSATSEQLYRELKNYDPKQENLTHLEDLPAGSFFTLGKKVLKKGPKSRKRYRCQSLEDRREYMVHPLAEVQTIKPQD
jgi:hypothetical protein